MCNVIIITLSTLNIYTLDLWCIKDLIYCSQNKSRITCANEFVEVNRYRSMLI